jgi:hypothetical protein
MTEFKLIIGLLMRKHDSCHHYNLLCITQANYFHLFRRKFIGVRGGKIDNMLTFLKELVTWYQVLLTGYLLLDTAMYYKEVHPPASHKACAPPFATHKATSQGGIISTDSHHII